MANSLGTTDSARPETIAAAVNTCLATFQVCLSRCAVIHPREMSKIEDQLAGLYTWARGIGVFAPQRASLDHRLRHAPEVYSVVNGLLESLDYRILNCFDIFEAIDPLQMQETATEDVAFGVALKSIAAEISRLNKVSNTIRRASKDTQTLRAKDFQIKDDEGTNIEPFILQIFNHHITDRFPHCDQEIQERLAQAMLLRRRRISYRRSRSGHGKQVLIPPTTPERSVVLPAVTASVAPETAKAVVSRVTAPSVVSSKFQSATTLDQERFRRVSSSPSIVSGSKTIAFQSHEELVFPPAPGLQIRRRNKELEAIKARNVGTDKQDQANNTALSMTELESIGEVMCPYCLQTLPYKEVLDETKWQLHVKNDLDPYICLFNSCDRPDELFTHSEQWISHLHEHVRTWRCSAHRAAGSFTSRESFIKHVQETHSTKLNETQLATIVARSSRKASRLFTSCPLCGQDGSTLKDKLEEHIAGHLRSLALKSLPTFHEQASDEGESANDSDHVSRARTRSTTRSLRDLEHDLLSFVDDHGPMSEPQPTSPAINFLGASHSDLKDAEAEAFTQLCNMIKPSEDPEKDLILQNLLHKSQTRLNKSEWQAVLRRYDSLVFEHGNAYVRIMIAGTEVTKANIDRHRHRYRQGQDLSSTSDITYQLPPSVSLEVRTAEGDWLPLNALSHPLRYAIPSVPSGTVPDDMEETLQADNQAKEPELKRRAGRSLSDRRSSVEYNDDHSLPTSNSLPDRDIEAYRKSSRPSLSDSRHSAAVGFGSIGYRTDGYQYTRPSELARYDLDYPRDSYRTRDRLDRNYKQPNTSLDIDDPDLSRVYRSDPPPQYSAGQRGPPPSTRGFYRFNSRHGDGTTFNYKVPPPTADYQDGPPCSSMPDRYYRSRDDNFVTRDPSRSSRPDRYYRSRDDNFVTRDPSRSSMPDRYYRSRDDSFAMRDLRNRDPEWISSARLHGNDVASQGFGLRIDPFSMDPRLEEPAKRSGESLNRDKETETQRSCEQGQQQRTQEQAQQQAPLRPSNLKGIKENLAAMKVSESGAEGKASTADQDKALRPPSPFSEKDFVSRPRDVLGEHGDGWSPDGRWVQFATPSPFSEKEFVSRPRDVLGEHGDGWSPDGRWVQFATPSQDEGSDKPVRDILKEQRAKFPEEAYKFIREGVAPHKNDKKRQDIPAGARWTKISRRIVNPDALTFGKERFEVRDDFIIVLRALSVEEIQGYAAATQVLQERRREKASDFKISI